MGAVSFNWRDRERYDVIEATNKLFVLFGVRDAQDRVLAYVELFQRECYCPACVTYSLGRAMVVSNRLPAPERILDIYQEAMGTEHSKHLVETGPELDAGRIEAFWRGPAREVIEEFGCSRDVALGIGAQMWWSNTVVPTPGSVREEMEGHGVMWLASTEAFLSREGPAKVEALYARARKLEAQGWDGMTVEDIEMRDPVSHA